MYKEWPRGNRFITSALIIKSSLTRVVQPTNVRFGNRLASYRSLGKQNGRKKIPDNFDVLVVLFPSLDCVRRDEDVLPVDRATGGIDLMQYQQASLTRCEITSVALQHTSMFVLIARLTLSMKTSNSSKQRRGEPMASQMARSKQIDENDFSPPDNVLVLRPVAFFSVLSGSTWRSRVRSLWLITNWPLKPRSLRRSLKLERE